MRNFYVGLDFYRNQIAIGLNEGTTVAHIEGSSRDTKPSKTDTNLSTFIVFFFVALFAIATYMLVTELRKEK